jgi:hypothetical protein
MLANFSMRCVDQFKNFKISLFLTLRSFSSTKGQPALQLCGRPEMSPEQVSRNGMSCGRDIASSALCLLTSSLSGGLCVRKCRSRWLFGEGTHHISVYAINANRLADDFASS